jgi:serine/threonine protein kinase
LQELFIAQELMDTDMYRLTQSKYHFTDDHIQAFMYQILRGLKAIHSANVLHRDLKPGNLLWKNNGEIKICDFGLARGLNEPAESNEAAMTNYVATRWYRPPEILLYKGNYGKSCKRPIALMPNIHLIFSGHLVSWVHFRRVPQPQNIPSRPVGV